MNKILGLLSNKSFGGIFAKSFGYSLISVFIPFLIVNQNFGLIALFVIAFYAHENISKFLQENKENIIDKNLDSKKQNLHTFLQILRLFLGIAVGYGIIMFIFNIPYMHEMFKELLVRKDFFDHTNLQIAQIKYIFIKNFGFLIISMIFAFIFRKYAIALFVSLGAVFMGLSTGYMFYFDMSLGQFLFNLIFVILPLTSTIFSVIIASVAIYFLETGLKNHVFKKGKSKEDAKIMISLYKTVVVIVIIAIAVNVFGTIWEGFVLRNILL